MSLNRAVLVRSWVELFVWSGMIVLVVLLFVLPFPELRRLPLSFFLVIIAVYLFFAFHFLFPRTQYAPRIIYATLFLDILIVGTLCMWLADYLPNLDIALIPLIGIAPLVSNRRGTLALALFAALTNLLIHLQMWAALPEVHVVELVLDQVAMAVGLVFTGQLFFSLMETIRRHSRENEQAALLIAELERQHRESFERSTQRFKRLNSVGLRVQQELQPEAICQVIAEEFKPLGCDFLILLWDEPMQTLRPEYLSLSSELVSSLEELTGNTLPAFTMDVRQLPPYQKAMAQRQAILDDAPANLLCHVLPGLSADQIDHILGILRARKQMVAPMFAGEKVIGFFHLWGGDLESEDSPAVTSLAQQIALALEKAHLLQREQRRATQLALVNEIAGRAVGLTDLNEVLKEVTRLIVQRFGFENAAILLNDARARRVVLRAHYGRSINFESIGYSQSWDVGLIGVAARTGETVLANDVRKDNRYFTNTPDKDICRAELSVPLKRREEVLAVLDVQSTKRGAFGVEDAAALETLSNLVAAIIEKGELFAAERKRAAQLALVSAIAERITAILDPNQLLDEVARLIRERFGYYNVVLLTLDATEQLKLRAVSGGYADLFPPNFEEPITIGLIGAAACSGSTIVVNDVTQDTRFYFPPGESPVTGSEMSVPIKIGNRVLGVLDIQTTEKNVFDASDMAAMETLANQIAVALENARLYAESKDEAELKATLLRELSHRVKNNLTAVVGLLSLGLDDDTIPRDEILNETLMRVQSMAVAHTLLANSPRARVDMAELSRRVIGDSIRQMSLPGQHILFDVHGDAFEVSAQQATSLALVLNELVANAIKHGGASSPGLSLCIRYDQEELQLEFSNQISSANDSSPEWMSSGIGLRLIRTLVEKDLGGQLTFASRDNTFFSIIRFSPQA